MPNGHKNDVFCITVCSDILIRKGVKLSLMNVLQSLRPDCAAKIRFFF